MPTVEITMPAQSQRVVALMQQFPERMMQGIRQGMDTANALVISDIQARRLTGVGPFPPSEHKLGIKSQHLRANLHASAATVNGMECLSAIGNSVKYAYLHEFGGVIHRKARSGTVRLRAPAGGQIALRGGRLATFARKDHKRVVTRNYNAAAYDIKMPERAPIRTGLRENGPTYARFMARGIKAEFSTTSA